MQEYYELEKLYPHKSSHYYQKQILSMMTDSDIAEIVVDKKKELETEKQNLKTEMKPYRGDDRQLLILLSEDRQNEILKIIKFFQFQLKQKSPFSSDNQISIDDMKSKIDIISLIENLAGINIQYSRKLIKCPLKGHDDSTASFKIYEHTNTFYCPGCMRGGDQISFIQHFYGISKKEAIQKFRQLTK